MEKEKKTTARKSTAKKVETPKKVEQVKKVEQPKKAEPAKVKTVAKKVEKPEVKVEAVKVETPATVETKKKTFTLNQDLNLLIGLLSILSIICLCFPYSGGSVEVNGWDLVIYGDKLFTGMFQAVMVLYVASLVIDCVLAINVNTENEILNVIEKALYMFTLVITIITGAILVTFIEKLGIGLIIFLILSIVNILIKVGRVYTQK